MPLRAIEECLLWSQTGQNKHWIKSYSFDLIVLWQATMCVARWQRVALSWGHVAPVMESLLSLVVQAGLVLWGKKKRYNTYKNFPFVFEPISTICSDSIREIFPWNQGIFSWAVVAISFSSWGFWLIMACSRAWPCHRWGKQSNDTTLNERWHRNHFQSGLSPDTARYNHICLFLYSCSFIHSFTHSFVQYDFICYLNTFKGVNNKLNFKILLKATPALETTWYNP